MGHQTTLDDDHDLDGAEGKRAGGIAAEFITLAEMQLRLFETEMRELISRTMWAIVAWLIAIALLAAAAPTALSALGHGLASYFEMSIAAGLLVATLGAVMVALACAFAGWRTLRSQRPFARSRQELDESLRLLKSVLANPEKPPNP